MSNAAVLEYVQAHLSTEEVRGKKVLELGSYDVNGSPRPYVEGLGATDYVGVDVAPGPGVDVICAAEQAVDRFGVQSFDIVISTEMLEHVRDWRSVVSSMKRVLRPGGLLVVTTRSRGFHVHGYPSDFWRFEVEDFRRIFSEMEILDVRSDPSAPGVFIKVAKPVTFTERDLTSYRTYSMVRRRRVARASDLDAIAARVQTSLHAKAGDLLPEEMKAWIRRTMRGR